ncbi:MAG: hypothetical protein GVY02_01495, partial [Bacteroidetes bacterium]|nr:hypothetical protein [Bacteroidota bacterium]
HRKEFDQPGEDLQTWESALRRGWFGHFLGGEKGEWLDDLLLYPSIQNTGDQEIWAAFTSYLNRLSIMQSEIKRKRSCGQWARWLEKQMDFIFGREAMHRMEGQKIIRITGQIREQCEAGGYGEEIPFSIFKDELSLKLNRQKASGALFTKGVTFSSMVPVRSIPFRIIALIGLNENSFPRKKISPDFDLMAQQQLPGERNRKNEDRNLFLESIMAAEEVHYCSFIGQSLEDNDEIPPSTIISEWVDILSGATGKPATEIVKKEALTGYSPANFESNRSYSKTYFQAALNILHEDESGSGMFIPRPIPVEEEEQPVPMDDLLQFYNNPVRWFFRSRFEAYLREPDEESDEFSLDHLETHLLFQRVFGWMMNDLSDRQIRDYLIQSGSVPSGWAGVREILDLKRNVETALSALREFEIVPAQNYYPVSLPLGAHQLEGDLVSYSQNRYADISPSGYSGKTALRSWIGHLCAQNADLFEEKESILFCELKKGDPKVKRFRPVEDPFQALAEMVNLYKMGLKEPQLFFPKTLYAYEKAVKAGKTEKAIGKAAGEFNSSDFKFGESSDLYIKKMLGENVEFRSEFIEDTHRKIIGRMIDHMEDG